MIEKLVKKENKPNKMWKPFFLLLLTSENKEK